MGRNVSPNLYLIFSIGMIYASGSNKKNCGIILMEYGNGSVDFQVWILNT